MTRNIQRGSGLERNAPSHPSDNGGRLPGIVPRATGFDASQGHSESRAKSQFHGLFRVFGLGLLVLTAGCTFSQDIAEQAVAYNFALEKASNELLLLNVVRAAKRRPMHFTRISQIRGNLSLQVGGALILPFSGNSPSDYIFSPSAAYRNNPTFDVAVLNSQEFMRAIITPIPMKSVEFYWNSGWPRDVLLHMFIERIVETLPIPVLKKEEWCIAVKGKYDEKKKTCKEAPKAYLDESKGWCKRMGATWRYDEDNDTCVRTFDNDPDDYNGEFSAFQTEPKRLDLKIRSDTTCVPIGPALTKSELGHLNQLTLTSKESGLKIDLLGKKEKCLGEDKPAPPDGQYQLVKKTSEFNFVAKLVKAPTKDTKSADEDMRVRTSLGTQMRQDRTLEAADEREVAKAQSGATIFVRSPQGMLFYLGEIMRALEKERHIDIHWDYSQRCRDKPPSEKCESTPLFVVRNGQQFGGKSIISVTYEGQRFLIPVGSEGGLSMSVVSLVSQILGQNTSAKELPTTQAVTITGQ